MTDLMPFAYGEQPVRIVLIDGEPWFVLADLCKVLGLSAVGRVAARLDEGVRQTHTLPTAGGIPPEARAWAERQLAERGPLPQHVIDLVAPLLRRDTRKTA